MIRESVVTTSANTVTKPTDVGTSADALEVTKRMNTSNPESQECCPTCGEQFANYRGVKIHHKKIHNESLRIQTCAWCECEFEGKPRREFCSVECHNKSLRGGEKPPAETLHRMHHEEEKPLKQMAEELGHTRLAITNWMLEYGIKWRGQSEAEVLKNENRTEAERQQQVRAAHEAIDEMVDRGEWHLQTENPERNGYGEGWTEEKRERARERYDRQCQACGMSESKAKDEFGCRLDVHHIIPWSYFDDPEKRNDIENLIPLCRSCHRKWEGIPLRPEVAE